MKDTFDFACDIARRAGEITLKYFQTSIDVERKADLSPVTIADRESEEFLRREIERRFPDDAIYGEEFGETPGKSGRRWSIDPIDGTKTFIRGVPLYGTIIAVEFEGVAKIGVVRYPATDETLAAFEGGGCWLNGERCRVSRTAALSEASAVTTDLANFVERIGEAQLMRLIRETQFLRTWGDCYGYLLVAAGRVDVCVDPIVELHDYLPLIPILSEAGGRLSAIDGAAPEAKKGCVGSNGAIHDAILDLLK